MRSNRVRKLVADRAQASGQWCALRVLPCRRRAVWPRVRGVMAETVEPSRNRAI